MKVIVEFEKSANGVGATSPDFPNVVAVGDDRDDALRLFREALHEHLAYHEKNGDPLDLPSDERTIEIVAA